MAALVGAGVLVIDHDLNFITGICDAVYCLDQGEVIARGTPAEVQADPLVRAAYLGSARAERSARLIAMPRLGTNAAAGRPRHGPPPCSCRQPPLLRTTPRPSSRRPSSRRPSNSWPSGTPRSCSCARRIAPCDTNGEPFEPAPVEIVLDNPEVFLRQVGNDDPVAMRGPGAARHLRPARGLVPRLPRRRAGTGLRLRAGLPALLRRPSVVYAHVATQADRPGFVALQYWFFWYHNPAKNDHEGDWEFVQLLFEADSVEEALAGEPSRRRLRPAHRRRAQRAGATSSSTRTASAPSCTRPRAPTPATSARRCTSGAPAGEGFGCDNTDGATRRLDPDGRDAARRGHRPRRPVRLAGVPGTVGPARVGLLQRPDRDRSPRSGGRNRSTGTDGPARLERRRSRRRPAGRLGRQCVLSGRRVGFVGVGVRAAVAGRRRWSIAHRAGRLRRSSPAGHGGRRSSPSRCATTAPSARSSDAALRVWRDHPLAMAWVGLVYIPVAFVDVDDPGRHPAAAVRRPRCSNSSGTTAASHSCSPSSSAASATCSPSPTSRRSWPRTIDRDGGTGAG